MGRLRERERESESERANREKLARIFWRFAESGEALSVFIEELLNLHRGQGLTYVPRPLVEKKQVLRTSCVAPLCVRARRRRRLGERDQDACLLSKRRILRAGQDILWRDNNRCPTEDEYTTMARPSEPTFRARSRGFLTRARARRTLSLTRTKTRERKILKSAVLVSAQVLDKTGGLFRLAVGARAASNDSSNVERRCVRVGVD